MWNNYTEEDGRKSADLALEMNGFCKTKCKRNWTWGLYSRKLFPIGVGVHISNGAIHWYWNRTIK